MASKGMVATVLAMFQEAFPTRPVSATTADVWLGIMAEVPDDHLKTAALRVARDPERTFFPTTGEVFAAIRKDNPPVDSLRILHRIAQLGFYDPRRGWVYPTYETVRDALGEEIARAYFEAGGEKVYAPEEKDGTAITREIARRKFGENVVDVQRTTPNRLLLSAPNAAAPLEVAPLRDRKPLQLKPGESPDRGPLAKTIKTIIARVETEPPVSTP